MESISFKSISQLNNDIYNNIHLFSNIDLVVGVPRSGLLVASIIALNLNLPLTDVESFIMGRVFESGTTKRSNLRGYTNIQSYRKVNALVVEDSVLSGRSINSVKERIKLNMANLDKFEIKYLGAYVTPTSKTLVDCYLDIVELPRLFEWNCFHHVFLRSACCDIDGVINLDPSQYENDDGENYTQFLLNAKPKIIPTREIGWLVTSRLEKYRDQTEQWLKKNGIKYKELIMLNGFTAEERRKKGVHAEFKASVYSKLENAYWFIESNANQASEINRISGKPVFCTENQQWYSETKTYIRKQRVKNVLMMIKHGDKQFFPLVVRKVKEVISRFISPH